MQRILGVLIGARLAVAAGMAAALLVPVTALAVVVSTTLTVTPTHGQAGAGFTASYTLSPCQTLAGTTADFYWNGYPPNGGKRLGSAPTDATCTARLSTAAPEAAKPGAYLVYGFIALPDGTPANGTLATAAYSIDPMPAQPSAGVSGATSGKTAITAGSGPAASVSSPLGLPPLAALLIAGLLAVLVALVVLAWLGASRRKKGAVDSKAA